MFDPCQFHLLEKKGTVSSLQRPGADLGPEYLEHLHYVFAFDVEDAVRTPLDRCSVHSFNKGAGLLGHLSAAWRCLRYCVRFVKTAGIDIVMTVDPYAGGIVALLVARLTGTPFVVGVQGEYDVIYRETGKLINPALKFRWLENLLANITISNADMVIVYVDAYRKYAFDHGADPRRTVTCRVGCDDSNFIPVAERGAPVKDWRRRPSDKLIAYTGRIDKRKYADHLLQIYLKVCALRDDVTCLFIGDGPDRPWIEEEVRKAGLEDRILFTGFIPNDEVWKMLRTFDVYVAVLAGLALIEAGCAEVAIVAYDTDWHSEFVHDGETGLLVPFKDTEAYARRIVEILDDEPRRRRLGKAAREYAYNTHRARVIMDTFIHYYETLIAAGGRPPYRLYRSNQVAGHAGRKA